MDQQFIELFKTEEVWSLVDREGTVAWTPFWETLPRTVRKERLEDDEIRNLEREIEKGEEGEAVVLDEDPPRREAAGARRMILGL